jgi:hypothetical protein
MSQIAEYTYADPLSLPRLDAGELRDSSVPAGVHIEPPGVPREFLRSVPEFLDAPPGVEPWPRINAGVYVTPPNFIVSSARSTILGYRTVLAGDLFYTDFSFGEHAPAFLDRLASPERFPNEDTGLRRAPNTGKFYVAERKSSRHIPGAVVNLNSTEPSNYGSFLFRVLPKCLGVKDANLQDLPMLVYANHSSYADLLEMAGIDRRNIIKHEIHIATSADRVITPSIRNPDAYLDPESRRLALAISSQFGEKQQPGRRLYISRLSHARNGGSSRVMQNEELLIDRLTKLGVDIFEPERHDAREQVKAFSSAEMVIGPSGAAMFNTIFCRPGTKVIDIESEPHWLWAHTGLFASCELRSGIFLGKPDPADTRSVHRRWNVDIDALVERVEDFWRA